jgi:hypothetical protein
MEPAGSLPHSQEPATCPYPEPDQPSPCPPSHFLKMHSLYFQHKGIFFFVRKVTVPVNHVTQIDKGWNNLQQTSNTWQLFTVSRSLLSHSQMFHQRLKHNPVDVKWNLYKLFLHDKENNYINFIFHFDHCAGCISSVGWTKHLAVRSSSSDNKRITI